MIIMIIDDQWDPNPKDNSSIREETSTKRGFHRRLQRGLLFKGVLFLG